jgi:hypothetical protein
MNGPSEEQGRPEMWLDHSVALSLQLDFLASV